MAARFDDTPNEWFDCVPSTEMSSETGAIMFWLRPSENPDNDHDIIELYESRYTDYLLVRLNENRVYVRIEDNDNGLIDVYGTQTLVEGQWTHVAVVQNGHALRLYIDGELDALEDNSTAQTWTSHLDLSNGGLRLGAGSWGHYIGDLDDVVFTNWAPTQAQIKNMLTD